MKFTANQLQRILDTFLGMRAQLQELEVHKGEIKNLTDKALRHRKEAEKLSGNVEVEFTDRDKDIIMAAIHEVLNERHWKEKFWPTMYGGDRDSLTTQWLEIARILSRKL